MSVNLSRGCWRLWLFFSIVWIGFCAYQVSDARNSMKKAEELTSYYSQANNDAKNLEGKVGITPIVSAHLADQISLNAKIISENKLRDNNYSRLLWLVPLISLIFAKGVPWVWEGFVR